MPATFTSLQEISLCKYCASREGLPYRTNSARESPCYICSNSLSKIPELSRKVVDSLEDYEFETFLVGAIVSQEILDREDELRSRLKIKGKENIKSQITKTISKKVNSATGKRVEYSRPDLTVLVSIVDRSVSLMPRSVWVSGSYRKLERGLPQRDSECRICNGLGCAQCNYTGSSRKSIQRILSQFLSSSFDAESSNFIWVGGEDENSLVGGAGRPFFAEILKPKRRKLRRTKGRQKGRSRGKNQLVFKTKELELADLKILDHKVTSVPQFSVVALLNLTLKPSSEFPSTEKIDHALSGITDRPVWVRLSKRFRAVQKSIQSIEVVARTDSSLKLKIYCDGGIPLKKLVTGQEGSVEPNLSGILGNFEIDRAEPFDILEVKFKQSEKPASIGNDVLEAESRFSDIGLTE